ncbi:MAG TPA: hypothetical protein VKZ63_13875 [Kofleriaceae bacterium]|nr:hypothetical protein [Kofleriaceae bacterium]
MKERDKKDAPEAEARREEECDPSEGYSTHVKQHIRSGKSEEAAEQARRDLEGPEAEELRRAEEEGKRHIAEPDPLERRRAPRERKDGGS